MDTSADPRPQRSRQALTRAVAQLVDERDVAAISIVDVCAIAGVSRPTFYQHFGDIGTLVQAAAVERLQEVFDATLALEQTGSPAVMLDAAVHRLMTGLSAHATFYRRVLDSAGGLEVHALVVDFVAGRLIAFVERTGAADPERIKFRARFLAAGATWLVIEQFGERTERQGLDAAASRIAAQLAESMLEGARA